jgi:hypothetical protein
VGRDDLQRRPKSGIAEEQEVVGAAPPGGGGAPRGEAGPRLRPMDIEGDGAGGGSPAKGSMGRGGPAGAKGGGQGRAPGGGGGGPPVMGGGGIPP